MPATELRQQFKDLYTASAKTPAIVDVPAMQFLTIDGAGDPNTSPEYSAAIQALYSVAYTEKFTLKKTLGIDYPVMPLEGLWWAENMAIFGMDGKEDWQWTMMIMQPEGVTPDVIEAARHEAARKKENPALARLRLAPFHEGLAVQILYVGPYADEGPTITALHAFIKEHGYTLTGKHHEIYLGDPRRSAPERLRTIIRQPVRAPSAE